MSLCVLRQIWLNLHMNMHILQFIIQLQKNILIKNHLTGMTLQRAVSVTILLFYQHFCWCSAHFYFALFLVVPLARCERDLSSHISVHLWRKICRRPNRPPPCILPIWWKFRPRWTKKSHVRGGAKIDICWPNMGAKFQIKYVMRADGKLP